ncbi:LytR/AlgR family response regulator transcription factor [Wenzhouxiangella sediminis]|uniref:DNA-binding response regulator n=1 Tax=Wenzhouxiangella sediminis TaxID=1792836 RepID=A0A3E1K656_9GAMM|nr:LytTR family DNA-binding domain-containing protein [Wenzhouxiangella sediminis]RFF29448.1 DNA-binding response regulator [Wenzhouxiangella sediminis]
MSDLRALIVDDEKPAADRLARLLEDQSCVESCGVVMQADRVLERCRELLPDVVLLDVEMPGLDGIEVARELRRLESAPAVIFVTAYEQYAVDAFELAAVDYLVKPVRSDRLGRALERARNRPIDPRATLRTRLGDRVLSIPVVDIRALVAEDKYTVVHFDKGEALVDDSLVSLEQRFARQFIRIHRKALVARRYLRGLFRDEQGQERVELEGSHCHPPVSRRNLALVRQVLDGREHGDS